MLSNKIQKRIIKGFICLTIAGQIISFPIDAMPQNEAINAYVNSNVVSVYDLTKENVKLIGPSLPLNYIPNKSLERVNVKLGKVMQRRFYDDYGKPILDIDYTSHKACGTSTGTIHKHVWENGKRGVATKLTQSEMIKYAINEEYEEMNINSNLKEQTISLSYNEFKNLLINNHEISFELYGWNYNIAYAKNESGQTKYVLTGYNENFIFSSCLQKFFYSKRGILEDEKFNGKTLEKAWQDVKIKEIY